ncbi:MAG: hypothetical protein Q8R60_12475 [Mycobacteriales bacterium]|nr:hypothetical protein [Mycobacteriales bacterium]
MRPLLLAVLLLMPACGGDGEPTGSAPSPTVASGAVLSTDGALLRAPVSADPGPETEDPACEEFAQDATCTTVGSSRWVVTRDDTGWTLTEYDVTDELERWVTGLVATGNGKEPTVIAVDLTNGTEPEALVQYAASYDLVSTGDIGIPQVVAHGDGVATVDGDEVRVAGGRLESRGETWVIAP